MKTISAANIAALASIVEGAKATGQIELAEIKSIIHAVERERSIAAHVSYVRSKDLTAEEKRTVTLALKNPDKKAYNKMLELADTFYRGDMAQLVPLVVGHHANDFEKRQIEAAAEIVRRPWMAGVKHTAVEVSKIAARLGIGNPTKTVRIPKRK